MVQKSPANTLVASPDGRPSSAATSGIGHVGQQDDALGEEGSLHLLIDEFRMLTAQIRNTMGDAVHILRRVGEEPDL